jgi:FixJ family two-component response regulator
LVILQVTAYRICADNRAQCPSVFPPDPLQKLTVNYMPQNAAVLSLNAGDAAATRSALGNYGFQVAEFSSYHDCLRSLGTEGESHAMFAVVAGVDDESIAAQRLAELKRRFPGLPVLVTATGPSVAQAVSLMQQGASSVVALPCGEEELRAQISQLMHEASTLRQSESQRTELRRRMATLTPAELSVLDLLLDGYANKQISQELNIGLRTVELRRSKIMNKMQSNSVAQLIKMICIARGQVSPADQAERTGEAAGDQ